MQSVCANCNVPSGHSCANTNSAHTHSHSDGNARSAYPYTHAYRDACPAHACSHANAHSSYTGTLQICSNA